MDHTRRATRSEVLRMGNYVRALEHLSLSQARLVNTSLELMFVPIVLNLLVLCWPERQRLDFRGPNEPIVTPITGKSLSLRVTVFVVPFKGERSPRTPAPDARG